MFSVHPLNPVVPDLTEKTILIVEDELVNYRLLALLLKRTNAKLIYAENGAQAIELINDSAIDIILMDLKMPIMDGYEATRQIKQIRHDIPIIALTAHSITGEKEKCNIIGCDGFLLKPIDSSELYETLSEIVTKVQ